MSIKPSMHGVGDPCAPAACQIKPVRVVIEHRDTLDRPLPAGGRITLTDASDKVHRAEIDEKGNSVFPEVRHGEFEWLAELDTDFTLVEASEKPAPVPAMTPPEPVSATAAPDEIRITAVYLPPAVLLNLREDDSEAHRLTEAELELFTRQGNNATVFIHGYGVPEGCWGDYVQGEEWQSAPNNEDYAPEPDWAGRQDVSLYRDPGQVPEELSFRVRDDSILNGDGARGWGVNMEYRLNRAAGMAEDDWRDYSRIISVAWHGDVAMTDFVQAELNAMEAGRRLVTVLQQLHEAGIAINIITHSLGARVALCALNILGELGKKEWVDHLFLWQPAVADNALSNSYENDHHPLHMGVFPASHRAVNRVVVLHSRRDGILGPRPDDDAEDRRLWERLFRENYVSRFGAWLREVMTAESSLDELVATLGGAYEKKWWTFPFVIDVGLGVPLCRYYEALGYGPLQRLREPSMRAARTHHGPEPAMSDEQLYAHLADEYERVEANWQELKDAMLAEVDEQAEACAAFVKGQGPVPQYCLLAPMAHHATINRDEALAFWEKFYELAGRNWRPEKAPRPALGYVGFDEIAGEDVEPKKGKDNFIAERWRAGHFDEVNQTGWLLSHSGMRVPSDDLFREIYVKEVMNNNLLRFSRFGRY